MSKSYTEYEWRSLPERESAFDWWDNPRNVVVKWGDPTETPSEAIARLNEEAIEYATLYKATRDKLDELRDKLEAIQNAGGWI